MAAPRRTQDSAVADEQVVDSLLQEPWEFQFFQAVRVLERVASDRRPVGEFFEAEEEVARFRAFPSTVFPASEIQTFTAPDGKAPLIEVNFMGLTGPLGVLPLYYTELIAERTRVKDYAIRDFLGIFDHRMISLFYRAWAKYRFPVAQERGLLDSFSHRLLDLIGLGSGGLKRRMPVDDSAMMFYAGLVSQQPHSAVGLEGILSDYFDVRVEVQQFVGCWYALDPSIQTCIQDSKTLAEQVGFGAVVGDETWDTQARARIRIGPLTLHQYLDFLPTGTAYGPLCALARFYGGYEIDFEAQLILDRESVPSCELGSAGGAAPKLGWVTWVKNQAFGRDPDETILLL